MPEDDPAQFGPAPSGAVGHGRQSREDLFGPGLVVDVGDTGGAVGVITDQATEHDDRPAPGEGDPLRGEGDIE